jgi:PAS domain S-box-containing protein
VAAPDGRSRGRPVEPETRDEVPGLLDAPAYRALFAHSPEPHFVEALDGTILDVNGAAADLHGWSRDELVGRSFRMTLADGDDEHVGSAIEDLRAQGWFRRRTIGLRRDGSVFPMEVVGSLMDAREGELILIHAQDLSASQALEDAARELAELARLGDRPLSPETVAQRAVEIAVGSFGADGGALVTFEGGRIRWRGTVGEIPERTKIEAGVSPETSVILRSVFSTGHAVTVDMQREAREGRRLAAALHAAGVAVAWILPVLSGDEHQGIIALLFASPPPPGRFDAGRLGAIGRIVGTALRNAYLRQAADASDRRYRTLFERSPDALLLLDAEGRIVDGNLAATRLYGTTRGWLVGRHWSGLAAGERPPAGDSEAGFRTWRAAGLREDGSTFPQEAIISHVGLDGELRDLVRVRDLTEQEQLQQELVQAQKMEAIGQLVSGVAHELNNPLAAIIAFSQLIRNDPRLPSDMRRDADLLVGEADRTRRIVQSLLDFARQRPPERHPTRLRSLVDSVLELQAYTLTAGQIEVSVDIPAEIPRVMIDRSQMQQVLLNLTINAIQAIQTTGRGTIRIAAREVVHQGGRAVRLSVTDDGPGVPPGDRARLFVPFFTTKEPGEGTGLGLPVSFGIVAAHAGQLTYEPGPGGQGSAFVIILPLDATAAPPEEPARTAAQPAQPGDRARPVTSGRRPHVLVLDDEPSIRTFLAKALAAAGFEAEITNDGEDAVRRIRDHPVDVVLCDHRMAGMTGTEVFDALVSIRPELARRFVFMSGDVLNPELTAFAGHHAVALLAKPFDIETVGRTVREIVDREPARGG